MTVQQVILGVLGGPIKFWWDDNWDTPLHWHYDAWREALSAGLVADGRFLVYRPHHAFKGTWTERGQVVNDAAINAGDVFFDMSPLGIPSEGTDSEKLQFSSSGGVIIPAAPPERKEDFNAEIARIIAHVMSLGTGHNLVDQRPVLECIAWAPRRERVFEAMFTEYGDNDIRLHYVGHNQQFAVHDVRPPRVDLARSKMLFYLPGHGRRVVPFERLLKAEALGNAA